MSKAQKHYEIKTGRGRGGGGAEGREQLNSIKSFQNLKR